MSRRRFFVPEIHSGRAELKGDDAAHLVRVLRAEPGQLYEICDNANVYLAEIESARKSSVIFRCVEKLPPPAEEAELILVTALFKFDRFEWLVEKATELGVARILPFAATRTEKGLELAAHKRTARWDRIAIEASEQARRSCLPVIHPLFQWGEALATEATHNRVDEEFTAELEGLGLAVDVASFDVPFADVIVLDPVSKLNDSVEVGLCSVAVFEGLLI